MNELPESTDLEKLLEAVECIKKTVRCSVCLKLPMETKAGKCGHPFCNNCVEKILNTKKAVCAICKSVIIRSAVHSVQSIDNIVKDISSLCEAIEKDSNTIIRLDRPREVRQYQAKRKSLMLPGPSDSEIEQEGSLRSESLREKENKGRKSKIKKVDRNGSTGSEKIIQIQNMKHAKKREAASVAVPSTSKAIDTITEPVFTADNLSVTIGTIGYKEKVEDWLYSEEFEDDRETEPRIAEPRPPTLNSPTVSEIFESFSQVKQNSGESIKSGRNSRASKTPSQNKHRQDSANTAGNALKFKSFTFEATDKMKQTIPKAATPADKMLADSQRKILEEQGDNKKARGPSVSTDDSWSELARLKKEAHPKVRKRKRLNVSIERPNTTRTVLESFDYDDSEAEKELQDIDGVENEKNKSKESNGSTKQRQMPALVSHRTLKPSEMIDIPRLNRRQVEEIIGVLDYSRNSSNSPDESLSIKCNKTEQSLKRSGGCSRNNTNEEETSSHFAETSRPQSKQSIHANDSRPGSRLSYKSTDKPTAEKFRLSTGRTFSTPNKATVINLNSNQQKEEEQEKIQLGSDSPVRVCNDLIRNKLSLKKFSSGSSKTPELENKSPSIMPIKKMGKLHKIRKRIKFISLGSTRSKSKRKESIIATCDAMTQTNPFPREHLSSESMGRIIIPETRTVSGASTDSRQIKEAEATSSSSKTGTSHELPEKCDTVNKVNMLSPEKDSQLKFLATKSPSVSRMNTVDSESLAQNIGNSCTATRETSFANSSVITEEYSKVVKKYAEKLIVTDSEDQDTPNESFTKIKRRNDHETKTNESEKAMSSKAESKSTSNLSEFRMDDEIQAVARCSVINLNKSPSLQSIGNNSEGNSSRSSLRRKRQLKDSLRSPAKRRDTNQLKSPTKTSGSYCEMEVPSDAETVLIERTEKSDQHLEDSETSGITAKHKVVRKLKYSQESGSNPNTGSGKSESAELQTAANKDKKINRLPEKKTFQRIRRISSTDSDEPLEISLVTKQSSSNSQTIERPGPSREVNKSPIPSEDLTVVFSSNKDTQESKRKRSPSPNSLDNHDLQAIASNWCADLDHSSEEIVLDNEKILGPVAERFSSDGAPPKKPRVDVQDSPASRKSDNFPALSQTAIYGKNRKVVEQTTVDINDRVLSNEESTLIADLDKVAAQFDGIDAQIRSEKSGVNSIPPSNTKHVNLAENVECSMKRGNTFNGIVTTSKSSTPIKAKSLEDRDLTMIHRISQNSDKENELQSQRRKKKVENKELLDKMGQKVVSNKDSHELQVNSTSSEKSEADNPLKSNSGSVPSKAKSSANNTELFESSFDRDCLNITQEQMLMKELEDNLLGRNSKNTTKSNSQELSEAKKSPAKNREKTLTGKKPATSNNVNQNAKCYEIAQIDTDDSDIVDEDIIESTPEKNLPVRKDLHPQAEYSQRSNASQESFMSGDMTPISKTATTHFQTMSQLSMRSGLISKSSSLHRSKSKNLSSGPLDHSTPKLASSAVRRSNLLDKSGSVKRDRRLCFVCSYLTLPEVQIVKAFARKYNAEYTATYKPEVTHVIVETNDRDSAGRTLKYLLGVAHKKWIVSFRWVTDSINQNKILDESDYEAVDSDTEEPGPRRSRLSDKPLFEEFAFVCMKPFSDITIEQLQDLLSSTGGTVVETLEDLASVTNKYKLILYNSDIHEPAVLENWRKRGHALPMQVEWVLSCISQYDLLSFRYYLQTVDIELLPQFNFPATLIAEEEDSYSMDEPST